MVSKVMMMKTKWYPRVHDMKNSWAYAMESGVENLATNYPLIMHDEAASPSTISTNPENSAFAETTAPNCMPDSRVNFIMAKLTFNMTKGALVTDGIHAIRVFYMVVHPAFLEDYTALDELSGATSRAVIEMQTESTDRQAYPIWNSVAQPIKYTASSTINTSVPGLTAGVLESITFDTNLYYDTLHYRTIAGKLKSIQSGIRWITLTRKNPVKDVFLRLPSKSKFINPYTYMGVIVGCPKVGSHRQYAVAGDTTNINHVFCSITARYNEWNPDFNFKKV